MPVDAEFYGAKFYDFKRDEIWSKILPLRAQIEFCYGRMQTKFCSRSPV
mgnify:FL=1